jgi:protein-disulfide isomerase
VHGAPILASELEQKVSSRLARLRQEEFELRRQALEEIVSERLLDAEAARRHLSRDELLRRELDAKVKKPSAETVEGLYRQNQGRFAGQPKDQVLARIRQALEERARSERRLAYEKDLRRAARVAFRLEPPRAQVDLPAGAPSTGAAKAPVTLVEFTDYQCPYCHRAQGVVDQLLLRYAGKLRLVHLDFPLEGHPGAIPAARGARCAGEQGRFWEYHRDLMTSAGLLDDADLKARASKLGLKPAPFAACLSSGRHDAAIRACFEQGESLGVSGTPAYFVNGRMVSGARPLEDFTEIIEAELAGR